MRQSNRDIDKTDKILMRIFDCKSGLSWQRKDELSQTYRRYLTKSTSTLSNYSHVHSSHSRSQALPLIFKD